MNYIIRFFLKQRLLGFIIATVVLVVGITSFQEIPIDAYPDVSSVQIQVIVKSPGLSPLEIEQRITYPIEIAVNGIKHQTVLRSLSKYSLSLVTIDFEDGTDIYWARQQVSERINPILASLPKNSEGGLAPITSPLSEIFMFLVEGKGYTSMELREVLDWTIRPRLRSVKGVADINALGGETKAYYVRPIPLKFYSYGLTLDDLIRTLKNNNENAGGDRIQKNDEFILIRSLGRLKKLSDIKNIVIKYQNGKPIHIHEVAKVEIAGNVVYGGITANGNSSSVEGIVLLRSGENARKTINGVKKELNNIRKNLPPGIKIVPFYDRSHLINKATRTLEISLLQGVLLVFFVIFLFLGNLRGAITIGMILPLSVASTFFLMNYFNISANLMSLGGLVISIGILVDSSVVVVENIYNFLNKKSELTKLELIYTATKEVAPSVFSAVIIILVSLLPIFALTGIEGKLFRPLAITLSFAIISAMVFSLAVIPTMSMTFMKKKSHNKNRRLTKKLSDIYDLVLNFIFKFKKTVILISILCLVAAFSLFPFIGKEFLPILDEGTMVIQTEDTPSISLKKSLENISKFQIELMKLPEIAGIVTRTGSDDLALDPMGFYQSDNFVLYAPKSQWKVKSIAELKNKIREISKKFISMSVGFTMPIDMRVSEIMTGSKAAIAIKVFGDNLDILEEKSIEIEKIIKNIAGSRDVIRTPLKGQQYLELKLNRKVMNANGISSNEVNSIVDKAIGGSNVGKIYSGNKIFPIIVRLSDKYRGSKKSISQLILRSKSGVKLRLKDITEITFKDGPIQITRNDTKRSVIIQCNVEGRDLVGFVNEAKKTIDQKVKFAPGYYINFGGQFENQQRATKRILLVIPLTIFIIFLLLYLSLKSLLRTLVIMMTIPFAFIGGILLLYLNGNYLSIPASLGFITLFGIAVESSIVMISYFNQLIESGMELKKAVFYGAKKRIRPVLMTATLTMLGLVPVLVSTGPGSEVQKPLAIVVFGGVFSSMMLTLFLIPLLYYLVENKRKVKN